MVPNNFMTRTIAIGAYDPILRSAQDDIVQRFLSVGVSVNISDTLATH